MSNIPVAVRFAWHKLAEPNLVNAAGLPAAPFRVGAVPQRDRLEMEVPEAEDYRLVYDLDLANSAWIFTMTSTIALRLPRLLTASPIFWNCNTAMAKRAFFTFHWMPLPMIPK